MRIGLLTSNNAFLKPIEDEFNRRGHECIRYMHSQDPGENAFQLGQLKASNLDRVFVDWAQDPLLAVMQLLDVQNIPTFVRLHRIEAYDDAYIQQVPWDKLAGVFFIAEHIRKLVEGKWPTQPKRVVTLPHVGINSDLWVIDEEARKWEPPWTIIMAGNVVPKKGVYSACQLLYDLPEEFHLEVYGQGGKPGYGNVEYHFNVGDYIHDAGLSGRILGRPPVSQEELAGIFARSHFVLSASNEEGCHTTIAEGMACGCVPLVNWWRGAEAIYPNAWLWRSPKEFYGLIDSWSEAQPVPEWAQIMRSYVLPKYDARVIAREVADLVCGPIDPKTVGEWYSTERYESMVAQDGNERQKAALQAAVQLLPTTGAASVLEIGCGTGYLSRELATIEGIDAYAQDVAEKLIEWAKEHNPFDAIFHLADATQQLVKGPHDLIIAVDVLEHIPTHHHETLIIRIADQLKPGGVFFARFPHRIHDHQIVEEHVFPKIVRRLCAKVGLKTERFVEMEEGYFEIVARKGAA